MLILYFVCMFTPQKNVHFCALSHDFRPPKTGVHPQCGTEQFPHLGSLTLAVLSDHRNPETSTVNAAGRGCRSAETESYI